MSEALFGIFRTEEDAARALLDLQQLGISPESVSVTMRDPRSLDPRAEREHEVVEGATEGLFGGGALGAAIGGLLGVAAITVPGALPLVIAGPLAGVMSGGAIGSVLGSIVGVLTHLGAPRHEAEWYVEQITNGGVLLTIHHPTDRASVVAAIESHGGVSVGRDAVAAAGFTPPTEADSQLALRPVSVSADEPLR